ncbi:MAG TPA: hypothetical protein VHV78_13715 [Gemmatimonadaceae bacterium]|jgi:hypothetical protein|nr:hypothetical protein [Gemmatimonadaceae bacterium]
MTPRSFGRNSKLIVLAAAVVTIAGVGCGTFTGVPASLPTISDSGIVYAINGAPPGAPTALYVFGGSLLAADATFTFDVAFDIDSTGAVVVIPQSAVASGLAPTHTVALQLVPGLFDNIASAPKSGYRADTATVLPITRTMAIQSQDTNACGTSITGSTVYGKVTVVAVDPIARTINVRFTTDPNCGFFSFASGIPTS